MDPYIASSLWGATFNICNFPDVGHSFHNQTEFDDYKSIIMKVKNTSFQNSIGESSAHRCTNSQCQGEIRIKYGKGKSQPGIVIHVEKCTCKLQDPPSYDDLTTKLYPTQPWAQKQLLIYVVSGSQKKRIVKTCSKAPANWNGGVTLTNCFCMKDDEGLWSVTKIKRTKAGYGVILKSEDVPFFGRVPAVMEMEIKPHQDAIRMDVDVEKASEEVTSDSTKASINAGTDPEITQISSLEPTQEEMARDSANTSTNASTNTSNTMEPTEDEPAMCIYCGESPVWRLGCQTCSNSKSKANVCCDECVTNAFGSRPDVNPAQDLIQRNNVDNRVHCSLYRITIIDVTMLVKHEEKNPSPHCTVHWLDCKPDFLGSR